MTGASVARIGAAPVAARANGAPIRVLDLRDTHEIGGPGKTILETYRAIDPERFQLHLGVFARRDESGESPFVSAAREYGMPVHVLRGHSQYDPRLVWRLVRLLRTLKIDIVHAHEGKSDVITYLASKIHRVPTVTTFHGWIGNSRKQRALIALDKRVGRGFDFVIAVSEKIRRDALDAGVPASRLRLLHNAIVVERYRRSGRRGLLAEVCGRDVPGPIIGAIGRLSAEKGHADLLEALAIVARQGGQVSAVLVGDGPERPRLEATIARLGLEGRVHLPGYLQQPERLLEDMDLMVLPSHTEGLPNAVLEALMMEVPVLATRVGGTPEVVTDGVTGFLVPAHDPSKLADGILRFLADREAWRATARAGRTLVLARFDFRARTQQLEALYLEMLGREAR